MTDAECQEVINGLINYTYDQIMLRMIAYGEPFEIALANHLEEICNEQVEQTEIR